MNNESRLRCAEPGRAHRECPSAEPMRHVEFDVLHTQQPQPTADQLRKAEMAPPTLKALNEAQPGEAYLALAMAAVWADRLTEDARRLTEEVRPLGLRPSREAQNAVERIRHEVAHCTVAIERVRREIERARSRA